MNILDLQDSISSYDRAEFDPAKEQPDFHQKQQIRDKIARDVADPESLLGTTADSTALALFGLSTLIAILNENGSAAVKNALSEAADGELVALAQNFLASIEAKEIKLPALEKGLENVVADIGARSTGVSKILTSISLSTDA